MSERTPVTVLTGFLGAGKTTLMNRVLTEQHGQRIAVIENEFGEVGIDHELVINAEEEIFEMNNGCICCTVRGDLIRILGSLMKRRDQFDRILIETTGMADPGPVVQTFFVDDDMKERLVVDAVVTLVDAKHVWLHLDNSDEVKEQIAFADVILLNKCDLVPAGELDKLEARIKGMNGIAKVHRTVNAQVPLEAVLEVGGFNLDHAMEVDPKFLEPEYPFEWGGIFEVPDGGVTFAATEAPDPSMKLVLIPVEKADDENLAGAREKALRLFSHEAAEAQPGSALAADGRLYELILPGGDMAWPVSVAAGTYAVFTEHYPEELNLELTGAAGTIPSPIAAAYKPDHEHDEEVSSVGIEEAGDCDGEKLNRWISKLLQEKGTDIFRMKGVFSVKGDPNRTIFQGVHMLLDSQDGGPWGERPRKNSLVFIGRDLDREALNASFRKCLV